MDRIIYFFTLKYKGSWESIYNALDKKEYIEKENLYQILSKKQENYLSLLNYNFPENLKLIYKPPFSIFWEGNLKLLQNKLMGLYNLSKKDYVYLDDKFLDVNLITFVVDLKDKNLISYLNSKKIN